MHQGGTRPRLASHEHGPLDHFVGDRIPFAILEELQARAQQPVAYVFCLPPAVPVHADAVEKLDGDPETLDKGGVTVIAESGVGLRTLEHRLCVQSVAHRTPPHTRINSSSTSRTLSVDVAA